MPEDQYPYLPPGGAFADLIGGALALGTNGTTLTPSKMVHHVTGTSASLGTITVPYEGFTGPLWFVADSVFAWTTTGNIAAVAATTLTANRVYGFLYDRKAAKWYQIGNY